MPKSGEALNLSLQLFDGATDKYPRARVFKTDGTELSGSPVNLSHVGGGLYVNSDLTMPSVFSVYAQYKVYNDSGHTTISSDHSDSEERFDIVDNSGESGPCPNSVEVIAEIAENDIQATIETAEEDIVAEVETILVGC